MTHVLVTGGAGFIGSHVADALLSRGHQVTVLDDLSGGFPDNVPAASRFVAASVVDHAAIDRLFAESRFDYVYHLAAYAAEGLSHFIKRFNYTNNVIGSVNLINAAINNGVKGFVFTSSIAVYGRSTVVPMTEETMPEPEDPYGIAKHAVERELAASRDMFGLDYMIFRPHNVYGPRQNIADRYRNVVGIFMNQILQDQPMTIFGDGTQTRAFSYIDDVAPIMAAALDEPRAWNQVFNVGADRPWPLNDLAAPRRCRDGRRAPHQAPGGTPRSPERALQSREDSQCARRRRRDDARRWAAGDGKVGEATGRACQQVVRGHRSDKEHAAELAPEPAGSRLAMHGAKSVTVVLPAYNEAGYIRPAVEDFFVPDVVDEVIVVDNNSRDGTAVEARQTRARVVQESRQGYGYALQRGIHEAKGDIVILAEPDGTFIGRDILKLLAYADEFDMVCGTRTTRELVWDQANMGWFLRLGNVVVAKMIQFLYGGPSLSDCGCTLRLTHRAALDQIRGHLTVGGSHFLPEMVILALKRRLRVIEVPVNYRGRVGESKITGNLKGTLKTGFNMIGIIIKYRFSGGS